MKNTNTWITRFFSKVISDGSFWKMSLSSAKSRYDNKNENHVNFNVRLNVSVQ